MSGTSLPDERSQVGLGGGGPACRGRGGVVLPMCALAVLEREASLPAQPDGVQAVARLVGEPEYGDAAWAAIFSNLKFTGILPAEGAIPASVASARQQLYLSAARTRIEGLVGEVERLHGVLVRTEVRELAEAVLFLRSTPDVSSLMDCIFACIASSTGDMNVLIDRLPN
eukprot:6189512-Pleurochrysis_carterae.AAC.1